MKTVNPAPRHHNVLSVFRVNMGEHVTMNVKQIVLTMSAAKTTARVSDVYMDSRVKRVKWRQTRVLLGLMEQPLERVWL